MRIACWIPIYKYAIRIRNNYCFPLQQWLPERASMLRYTNNERLFNFPLRLPSGATEQTTRTRGKEYVK
jgi:hypothetical protein